MNKKTLYLCATLLATVMVKTNCGIFSQMDEHFSRMHQEMERMRASFSNWHSNIQDDDFFGGAKLGSPKNRININQQDDKMVISLNLGKGITEFDAKIKTKKEGYKQDQLIVTTKEPAEGKIVISVNGKYLSINQNMQRKTEEHQEKKEQANDKDKQTQHAMSYQSSSFHTGQTLKHKLNIDETNITYDDKEGALLIEIPTIKEADKTKKIEVKIKK